MRTINLLTERDWKWNMTLIDKQFKNGELTKEEAYRLTKKITNDFKTGANNRLLGDMAKKSGRHKLV